jgi:hypothetical protein
LRLTTSVSQEMVALYFIHQRERMTILTIYMLLWRKSKDDMSIHASSIIVCSP